MTCGRFARYSLSREIERFFNAQPASFELQPNYNVAPTQEIPVIITREDGRHIKKRYWGLVPVWAKDTSIGSRMVNARVETVASKPAFRAALKQRRCLIPANGFYEWKGMHGTFEGHSRLGNTGERSGENVGTDKVDIYAAYLTPQGYAISKPATNSD